MLLTKQRKYANKLLICHANQSNNIPAWRQKSVLHPAVLVIL